ncbi:hypothetical protein Bhyg_12450 [Pseudolycoriella hygida]|uniref:Uncharacterized protein n=1 Tax=Pseudolycoriella hygida TaxID=35572 RepID=A0A9Q0S180_9DIPT|nr:hypothetical protein Bhyg_12450 [Pseudolycoriella hygida]
MAKTFWLYPTDIAGKGEQNVKIYAYNEAMMTTDALNNKLRCAAAVNTFEHLKALRN